mgnify:CR=1 FL=1
MPAYEEPEAFSQGEPGAAIGGRRRRHTRGRKASSSHKGGKKRGKKSHKGKKGGMKGGKKSRRSRKGGRH